MEVKYAVLFILVGGIVGAAAIQAIHAQTKPRVYMIFENEIMNKEAYEREYVPEAVATVKSHGGRMLAVSGDLPKEIVGISVWESMEQLEDWVNSSEYRKVRTIGEKYAKYRTFAVPGVAQ
jgi:uncharacterized protein (DUF1330 family)